MMSPEIDPDPEEDAPDIVPPGLPIDHAALHLDGAANRVDDAAEFGQHAIAGNVKRFVSAGEGC
jgi:hypothetical protein